MRNLNLFLSACVAALGLAGGAAHATVTAPQVDVSACLNGLYTCIAGASQDVPDFGTAATGPASATAAGAPGISVQATSGNSPFPGTTYAAGADVIYWFNVSGAAGTNVPINIAFHDKVAGGGGSAQAYIDAGWTQWFTYSGVLEGAGFSETNSGGVTSYLCNFTSCATPLTSFNAQVEANTAVRIEINANAAGPATAYMDPLVTVDPTWARNNPALASQVAFEFYPGAQNGFGAFTAGAPEPATWSLMFAGFGLLGGALRGRPRRGVAA